MTTDPTQPLPVTPDDTVTPQVTETADDTMADDTPRTVPGVEPDAPSAGYTPSAEAASAYPPPAWTAPPADAPREVSTSVRTGTIVWGAILVVAGVVLAASAAGLTLDLGLVAIVALAGAGVALLAGALTTSVRRSRRERAR